MVGAVNSSADDVYNLDSVEWQLHGTPLPNYSSTLVTAIGRFSRWFCWQHIAYFSFPCVCTWVQIYNSIPFTINSD